ncbi:MAG: hypothetical protein PF503_17575 [Desulfobacula sp.]|jgi:hypothetical protein|nr:hypothetical protein [Desulfobacula sp.]
MSIGKNSTQSLALDSVKQKFKIWRKTRIRGSRIPGELWQAAINVYHSGDLTLDKVARELRLNQSDFRKHIQKDSPVVKKSSPPTFIEMHCEPQPGIISECIVEMEDCSGSKMKMCFRGKTEFDLLELGKSFWSKQV